MRAQGRSRAEVLPERPATCRKKKEATPARGLLRVRIGPWGSPGRRRWTYRSWTGIRAGCWGICSGSRRCWVCKRTGRGRALAADRRRGLRRGSRLIGRRRRRGRRGRTHRHLAAGVAVPDHPARVRRGEVVTRVAMGTPDHPGRHRSGHQHETNVHHIGILSLARSRCPCEPRSAGPRPRAHRAAPEPHPWLAEPLTPRRAGSDATLIGIRA